MGFLSKIVGTHSEREVKRVIPIVNKIESMEPEMEKLSDEELRGKTDEFKKRLAEGETLDDILPEAYAVVREASKRTIGLRHFRRVFPERGAHERRGNRPLHRHHARPV